MTGKTITGPGSATSRPALVERLTASRAARELGLRRGELDLAVRLGCIRTVIEPPGGPEPPGTAEARRRITREEIDRLRLTADFPEALRARVRTVSTPQAARELGITTERFTRLARLGLLTPVAFYVNRYRTVVWLYLAEELRTFAALKNNDPMLTDRLPESMRSQLDRGVDLRPRNWRSRHAGFLLRMAEDAWARAAVTACLLDAAEVAEVVEDSHERAYLSSLAPEHPHPAPLGSPAARAVEELLKAAEPEEIAWLRASLSLGITEARKERAAPRLGPQPQPPEARGLRPGLHSAAPPHPGADPGGDASSVKPATGSSVRLGRLFGWFRRGRG